MRTEEFLIILLVGGVLLFVPLIAIVLSIVAITTKVNVSSSAVGARRMITRRSLALPS